MNDNQTSAHAASVTRCSAVNRRRPLMVTCHWTFPPHLVPAYVPRTDLVSVVDKKQGAILQLNVGVRQLTK